MRGRLFLVVFAFFVSVHGLLQVSLHIRILKLLLLLSTTSESFKEMLVVLAALLVTDIELGFVLFVFIQVIRMR